MRILVLGSNGQLGSDVCDIGKLYGHSMIALTREILDIENIEQISNVLEEYNFDILVNCTSYHKTDELESNVEKAFTVNAFAVRAISRYCEKVGAKLIHVSTDYVHGGDCYENPISEIQAGSPLNVYGSSKLLGENFARNESGSCLILRVSALFGVVGSSGKGGNFVETMLTLAATQKKLKIVGDQHMVPTSTSFIATSIFKLLSKSPEVNGILNVVPCGYCSWADFAQRVFSEMKIPIEIESCTSDEFPTIAKRPNYSVLNNSKLCDIIGPVENWEYYLREYLTTKGHIKESGL